MRVSGKGHYFYLTAKTGEKGVRMTKHSYCLKAAVIDILAILCGWVECVCYLYLAILKQGEIDMLKSQTPMEAPSISQDGVTFRDLILTPNF